MRSGEGYDRQQGRALPRSHSPSAAPWVVSANPAKTSNKMKSVGIMIFEKRSIPFSIPFATT